MSAITAPVLRTVTFGDLDGGIWGACWGAAEPFVVFGELEPGTVPGRAPVTVEGSAPTEDWRLSGEGVELTLTAPGKPWSATDGGGFEQLCHVRGQVERAGGAHQLDCLGRRRVDGAHPEFGSLRDLSGWFAPDQGLALTALRPHGAGGHDQDVITAAIFEPTGILIIAEPRLSTTYSVDGVPARVGLELWLEADEDGEQYPRRAAAEALGAPARFSHGEHEVQARALRWHSRGLEGPGVYLLVRSR